MNQVEQRKEAKEQFRPAIINKKEELNFLLDKKSILEEDKSNKNNVREINKLNTDIKKLSEEIYNYDNDIMFVDIKDLFKGKIKMNDFKDILVLQTNLLNKEIIEERNRNDIIEE